MSVELCDVVSVTRLTHRTLQKAGLPPLWPGVHCTGAQAEQREVASGWARAGISQHSALVHLQFEIFI